MIRRSPPFALRTLDASPRAYILLPAYVLISTQCLLSFKLLSQAEFEQEFVKQKLTLSSYVRKLQRWRDKAERNLDTRSRTQSLDGVSHWLAEYHQGQLDEIEVPGQYLEVNLYDVAILSTKSGSLQLKDNSSTFVRINRFAPYFELCRAQGYAYRRITIYGHDGTKHAFAIQSPAARHVRREDRITQMFRIFNRYFHLTS